MTKTTDDVRQHGRSMVVSGRGNNNGRGGGGTPGRGGGGRGPTKAAPGTMKKNGEPT